MLALKMQSGITHHPQVVDFSGSMARRDSQSEGWYQSFSTSTMLRNIPSSNQERRKHLRLSLRLPVLLFRTESEKPVRGQTTDISNGGFHCTTNEPFAPGEKLRCLIVLPAEPPVRPAKGELCLDGTAEVVRVTADNQAAGFRIGFCLSGFHVVRRPFGDDWHLIGMIS